MDETTDHQVDTSTDDGARIGEAMVEQLKADFAEFIRNIRLELGDTPAAAKIVEIVQSNYVLAASLALIEAKALRLH